MNKLVALSIVIGNKGSNGNGQRRREPQLTITQEQFGPGGSSENPVVFEEVGEYFEILENRKKQSIVSCIGPARPLEPSLKVYSYYEVIRSLQLVSIENRKQKNRKDQRKGRKLAKS